MSAVAHDVCDLQKGRWYSLFVEDDNGNPRDTGVLASWDGYNFIDESDEIVEIEWDMAYRQN